MTLLVCFIEEMGKHKKIRGWIGSGMFFLFHVSHLPSRSQRRGCEAEKLNEIQPNPESGCSGDVDFVK